MSIKLSHPSLEQPNPAVMPSAASTSTMLVGGGQDDLSTTVLFPSSFEDEKTISIKPLLPRSLSYTGSTATVPTTTTSSTNSFYQQRRRRIGSENSLSSLSSGDGRHHSFGRDVGHAVAETFLLTRLSLKLLRYLGVGYKWITRFLALGCYSLLLIPGFLQVGYYYFFSTQVRRSVVYGDQPRNKLDLYLPKNTDGPKPVVAFVTGGAWIIGYKAWGCLLGQHLSERDIIVACIDYRNFPQGTMSDMVKDASQGISFVCNNIAEYGGDPDRIYLMGQSAGAHIAACTLLEQAIKEAGEGESTSWSVSQLKAYFGLSGGYNLVKLIDYFHGRGLYRSVFSRIMEGEQSLRRFSPEVMVQDPNIRHAVSLLPPIILFHGTADYSIPSDASFFHCDYMLIMSSSLMGQSAGAHIAACTLLEQAIKEAGEGESTSWSVSQLKAYFGLSGGYNLVKLIDYFHGRGLYRSVFSRIMEGEQSLRRFSPEVMVQDPNIRHAVSLLPPIILFHGTADYSIPSDASKDFAETLQKVGVKAQLILYEGKTHTDIFLQDPMRGEGDQMFEDLVAIIHADDTEALAKDAAAPPRRRLVPEFMLQLARRVSPF
ncbi:putative isoprenylcysteine alpha-carbonyl methylesterase ICMEL1 [Morella rubra]|uniref:protein-S-isoprenylcysteine alpha-carbonyl methylesterase n=1 Tax=Morella rubra TaxID=262757 RepID=A0A6A1V1A9_9ROSI|nr:putative isoprenylcysteine alpha-carbonyl methylesterase ICMEL1 [Morella rubra]